MKELTAGLAKLVAIIVILAALAVWTAALSLWANADAPALGAESAPTASEQTLGVATAAR